MLGLSLVIINRDIKEYCFPSLMAFFLICSNSIIFPGIYTKLDMEPLPLNIQN